MSRYLLHFDGSNTPDSVRYGWYIQNGPELLKMGHGVARPEIVTSNVAEYYGLKYGLDWFVNNIKKGPTLYIYGDSQLIVNHINNRWRCLKPHLIILRNECRGLLKNINFWTIEWIPREANRLADALSRRDEVKFEKLWEELHV